MTWQILDSKEIASEPKELGSAEINITKSEGVITVRHGECGTVLSSWLASGNDWNAIWETIRHLESVADDR